MTRQTPRRDADLLQAMKTLADVSGLRLADDRLEHVLPTYRAFLDAIDRIARVELPIDVEPLLKVVLPSDRRS